MYNSLFYFKKKQTLFLNKTQNFVPFKTEDDKEIQIAFIVNKNINIDKISTEDIYNIYNNKISHWGSISDQGIDIIPIANSIDSISNKAILRTLIKNNEFNKRYIKIEPSTQKILQTINSTIGSVSYLTKEEFESLDFKLYPNIKALKIKTMSVLISKKTLTKNENEIINTLGVDEVEKLIKGKEKWINLISKDIKLKIIKYFDQKEKIIQTIEKTEGTLAVVPWHYFQNIKAPFIKMHYFDKSSPLNLNFILSIPRDSGAYGGISYLILNTFYVILLTTAISICIGIGTGIMLAEYTSNKIFYKILSMSIDILSSIPAIIFGLFGLIFFVPIFGMGILSGAITSSLMILPMIVKTTEETFKTIPKSYKYASFALGANKTETIILIMVPAAIPGILTGIVLAIGRALGETAVLLFTMGTNLGLATNLNEPSRTLTVHLLMLFQEGHLDKGFGTASILVIMILIINLTSKFLINKLYRIK
ncbi:phosphate ABC transporter permease PstA [Borreliella tanukii]|uniref:phosphate ABC transporter permease PstA n=1 Tax=Borreliella tanukii TaxID=56146 RepID=UPI0026478E9C|nr:phosphate ABC transporter permease PstA [Borreliella tanukii]WKC80547.1 phosphate ABC transporter permease PstA [Borreliella tanukii]